MLVYNCLCICWPLSARENILIMYYGYATACIKYFQKTSFYLIKVQRLSVCTGMPFDATFLKLTIVYVFSKVKHCFHENGLLSKILVYYVSVKLLKC